MIYDNIKKIFTGYSKIMRQILSPYLNQKSENNFDIPEAGFVPPGHYYSPIPDQNFINEKSDTIFKKNRNVLGINLNIKDQINLLNKLTCHYKQQPFKHNRQQGLRYYFNNNYFSYSDGIFLYCLMRYFKPSQVIEIGSGFSSALMLDVNELCYNNSIELIFIEPHPERLQSLISDDERCLIIRECVQDVNSTIFENLEANDILFIDSSHVSKVGSDLNYIVFEILPRLKTGVVIHFHDIFYPFEYPKEWVMGGRYWNEIYLIRAFLMNNKDYEIILFPSLLEITNRDWLNKNMPDTLKKHEKWPSEEWFHGYLEICGQSLWLKKTGSQSIVSQNET
jgi:predicted O-methyltransferase YrrM